MITGPGLSRQGSADTIRPFREREDRFADVGPDCDLVHRRRDPDLYGYADFLLLKTLEVGFRLAQPGRDRPAIRSDHTLDCNWMFKVALSSADDEFIADATYAWIAHSDRTSTSSLACYLADRVVRLKPFSPRLRQAGIHVICCTWDSQLTFPAPEVARLLNHLEVDVDEMEKKDIWVNLLVSAIRSPMGFESLSSHNWRLLEKLLSTKSFYWHYVERDMEVMRSLEKAEDWEKLEVWMGIVWMSLRVSGPRESMEGIEQVTLELFLRQPSALRRFENLCESGVIRREYKDKLEGICKRTQVERLPSEPPYVSDPPAQGLSVLILLFFSFSQSIHSQPLIPLPFWGDDTFRVPIVHTTD